jgi:two-component system chemotaxis response regulator CheB
MQTNESLGAPTYIIVIGASAGGLNAASEFVGQLNADMDIAAFIVLHLSSSGIGDYIAQRLQQVTSLVCKKAVNNDSIERGHIYVAPPRHHLVLKDNTMLLGNGPVENRWKPSIDVLFRSAAVNFKTRTIGVILTGLLDDGRAGMTAIKKCGGRTIVQDPKEAEYPDMPLAVLESMQVDYNVPLANMGHAIKDIITNPPRENGAVPDDVKLEAYISGNVAVGIENLERLGTQSIYTCPDCGGALWEINDGKNTRFRCYVGHAYSEKDLVLKQTEKSEATLWMALRMMEERKNLHTKLEKDNLKKGFVRVSASHRQKVSELEEHIDKMKEMLFAMQNDNREAM